MAIETNDDLVNLISKLPDDARRTLPMILAPIQKYEDLSERLFKKYGTGPPNATGPEGIFNSVRRVNLSTAEAQQLNQALDTLKSCNDGLFTISPAVPGYYSNLAQSGQILEISDEYRDPLLDALQRYQRSSNNSQDVAPLVDGMRTEFTSHSDDAQSDLQESTRRVSRLMIELLHSTCVRVIRLIEKQYPDHKIAFQALGDRLAIWGSGLFNGQVSLDRALSPESIVSKARELLKKSITGTLADTAIILGEYSSGFSKVLKFSFSRILISKYAKGSTAIDRIG